MESLAVGPYCQMCCHEDGLVALVFLAAAAGHDAKRPQNVDNAAGLFSTCEHLVDE